jgi:nicotinamidase/pyrazinamidase
MKNTHLLAIDCQNDFCTPVGPAGEQAALFVPGADHDMNRLAKFIVKNKTRLSEIHCTLDSHQAIHIAHPTFWRDSKGNHPDPFTLITADDVRTGVWSPFTPKLQIKAQKYVDTLATNGRYVLCIWPLHCLIGTWGHSLVPDIANALYNWEKDTFSRVNFTPKGSNYLSEHYSCVQADVQYDDDVSTKLNTSLIDSIKEADEILTSGEALSHCLGTSITDIANNFGDDNIKKITLLTDTSSSVTGFEQLGIDFVKNMTRRGMKISNTKDW